jgi:signal transduction histidine kinase
MRLVSRLVLGLGAVLATVMSLYGITSLRQREQLIGDALVRETEALAHTMQIVANSALRNGQLSYLDRVLERVLEDSDVAISAVVGAGGTVLAGGPKGGIDCLDSLLRETLQPPQLHVWADCGGRVRLVALPLRPPGELLVLARRTTVVDRDTAASRRRILLTTIALAVLASLAVFVVIRIALTRPLSHVLRGVHQLGGPNPPEPVVVPRAARELQDLSHAFNEMIERLEGKRQTLIRETEERVELERRLRHAELFAALGRLTAGVAHELGSPLGVIGVRAESIQASPGDAASVRRHAAEISGEVDRIAGLVRDLLHVARRHGPEMTSVDLRTIVREIAAEHREVLAGSGIDLRVETPDDSVPVLGDPRLLRHALHNVVQNAVQALSPHRGEKRIMLVVQRMGEVARIVVEDTGPGIAPEHLPHLFEPFYTTKDVGEGSGLGLPISAGIIGEHGGTITVVPTRSGGVRAHMDLPTHTDDSP